MGKDIIIKDWKITGDLSCKIGNLGALCEQCDLYNFLGQGSYSRNN